MSPFLDQGPSINMSMRLARKKQQNIAQLDKSVRYELIFRRLHKTFFAIHRETLEENKDFDVMTYIKILSSYNLSHDCIEAYSEYLFSEGEEEFDIKYIHEMAFNDILLDPRFLPEKERIEYIAYLEFFTDKSSKYLNYIKLFDIDCSLGYFEVSTGCLGKGIRYYIYADEMVSLYDIKIATFMMQSRFPVVFENKDREIESKIYRFLLQAAHPFKPSIYLTFPFISYDYFSNIIISHNYVLPFLRNFFEKNYIINSKLLNVANVPLIFYVPQGEQTQLILNYSHLVASLSSTNIIPFVVKHEDLLSDMLLSQYVRSVLPYYNCKFSLVMNINHICYNNLKANFSVYELEGGHTKRFDFVRGDYWTGKLFLEITTIHLDNSTLMIAAAFNYRRPEDYNRESFIENLKESFDGLAYYLFTKVIINSYLN